MGETEIIDMENGTVTPITYTPPKKHKCGDKPGCGAVHNVKGGS